MKIWRTNARRKLKEQLGNRCVDCNKTEDEKPLHFAHVIPLSLEQKIYRVAIGSNARLRMYRREALEGLLTLRCASCNTKQSKESYQGFFTFLSNDPF
jgi:hypothetical protein